MAYNYKNVSKNQVLEAIRRYNDPKDRAGNWYGRPNVEIDCEGRKLFQQGLASNKGELIKQLHWIACDYAGVMGQGNPIVLCEKIARNILHDSSYRQDINELSPLVQQCPSASDVERLFGPFQVKYGTGRKWMTLASKFWHFLRPDVFAPMDSRAKTFFDLKGNDPCEYRKLLKIIHDILKGCQEEIDLAAMKAADGAHYLGDIKMIDKVAYVLGK